MTSAETSDTVYDVVVIGAGAAGIGAAVAIKHAGVKSFLVIDRHAVGASFTRWPQETRFITPSFPTNSVGMLDINSIALGTSPAFGLKLQHPSGKEYAYYLKSVAELYELPIRGQTNVTEIVHVDIGFCIKTDKGPILALHVVWAAGEFQYPQLKGFEGVEHCRHTATVPSYKELEGDAFTIIGGYESGVDAAYHLATSGKRVRLFDAGCPWKSRTSDPSVALSPFTLERMRESQFATQVELHPDTPIDAVDKVKGGYEVITQDGYTFETTTPPLLANGFEGGHQLVKSLFELREDGFPLLSEHDESTITPGLFLCGPAVRHENLIFCFIFKYRQRFAVVAKAIATSLGLKAEDLEEYRNWGMYLDDLSCCGTECAC